MTQRIDRERDAFTFSLGGIRTASSYAAMPAIAHDRINKALDKKYQRAQEDQPETARVLRSTWGRFWLSKRRRAA